MPPLRDLQTRFMRALVAGSPDLARPLIAAPAAEVASRIQVYQSTAQSNFELALRSTYPVVERLVGAKYFRQTVRDYQRIYPSRSGDLRHAGQSFAAYLGGLHHRDEFEYLADVARLEWLIQESLLSADHAAWASASLAEVAPDSYAALRFELHPALRLYESRYPAQRIWENNSAPAEPEIIDLGSGGDRLAIMRLELQLRFHRLGVGEQCFLRALAQGQALATALAQSSDCDSEFDPSAALQRFVAAQVIVGFQLPESLERV